MLPLRPGFDPIEPVGDGEGDGLVVADLEMQEWMILDAAPVASVEAPVSDEVNGARDVAPAALGHHQEQPVRHALADQGEEAAIEIGPPPFARAGIHVKGEEGVPMRLCD